MYTRENYYKVKDLIEKRRESAIAKSEAKCIEVSSISDDMQKIDKELHETGLLLFKTACSGGDITPIRNRNQELQKLRRTELVRLGFPEDYTDIHYTCEKCSDSGFVGTKICSCFKEMLIIENIKSSGMGNLIEKQTFENFKLKRYEKGSEERMKMKSNILAAKEFAETFKLGAKNLVLMGPTGTGKTHISTAIAKIVIERGFEVLYDSAQNIVSAFEADRFKSGYGPYEPKGDKYLECDLLILDDLGTEFVNQFTVSCLYNLLNTRQNKGLPTIISTNLSPDDIARKYEDRIYSRIMGSGSHILLFAGSDMRINGK